MKPKLVVFDNSGTLYNPAQIVKLTPHSTWTTVTFSNGEMVEVKQEILSVMDIIENAYRE